MKYENRKHLGNNLVLFSGEKNFKDTQRGDWLSQLRINLVAELGWIIPSPSTEDLLGIRQCAKCFNMC